DAAARLLKPERLAGLVAIAGTARFIADRPGDVARWRPGVLRKMRLDLSRDRKGTLSRFAALVLRPPLPGAWPAEWWDSGEWLPAGLDYLAAVDLCPTAASIRCPALVIHGAADAVIPAAAGADLAARLPNAHHAVIPAAGHAVHVAKPAAVADTIVAWLAAGKARDRS
ncbi:MAG TPA: alpha/beta hydrolase, partial [Limnochordia bacterium]